MVTGVKYLSNDLHSFVIAFFRCLFGLIIVFPFIARNKFKAVITNNFKIHILIF